MFSKQNRKWLRASSSAESLSRTLPAIWTGARRRNDPTESAESAVAVSWILGSVPLFSRGADHLMMNDSHGDTRTRSRTEKLAFTVSVRSAESQSQWEMLGPSVEYPSEVRATLTWVK